MYGFGLSCTLATTIPPTELLLDISQSMSHSMTCSLFGQSLDQNLLFSDINMWYDSALRTYLHLTSHQILTFCTSMMLQHRSASPTTGQKRDHLSTLEMGPRKKPYVGCHGATRNWLCYRTSQDPLIHHSWHFGRAIHAFCNMQTLLTSSIVLMLEDIDINDESLTAMWAFIGQLHEIVYWCMQQTENRRNMLSLRNSCTWCHPWKCISWNHLKR